MPKTITLACGHRIAPVTSGPTGYANVRMPRKVNGRRVNAGGRICYACAHALELEDLRGADRAFGYLSSDLRITTWSGGTLATVEPASVHKTRAGFGGDRLYFRATSADGARWACNSPGPGLYCRMRRMKG